MELPPDDIIDAAVATRPAKVSSPDLRFAGRLEALVAELRSSLEAATQIGDMTTATPEERSRAMELREILLAIKRDATTWVDSLDLSFRLAAARLGAKQIPLASGHIKVEPQRGTWTVRAAELHKALEELVSKGVVTKQDLEATFTTVITETADNRKLNYLAANRGDAVREVIEAHRTYTEPNPMSAKITVVRSPE